MRERVFRNYYEGHMEKNRGEDGSKGEGGFGSGGREGLGENADNCN